MALTKCKECGAEVSKKAETCPSCGAPVSPKRKPVGCGTAIVLVIFAFVMVSVFQAITGVSQGPSSNRIPDTNAAVGSQSAAPKPQWQEARPFTNEMNGKVTYGAYSPDAEPSTPLDFPYSNMKGSLFFVCQGPQRTNEQIYFEFTQPPNIASYASKLRDGYAEIDASIKFRNRSAQQIKLTQRPGSKRLLVASGGVTADELRRHESIKLELSLYGDKRAVFTYELEGSSAAIEAARSKCKSNT